MHSHDCSLQSDDAQRRRFTLAKSDSEGCGTASCVVADIEMDEVGKRLYELL